MAQKVKDLGLGKTTKPKNTKAPETNWPASNTNTPRVEFEVKENTPTPKRAYTRKANKPAGNTLTADTVPNQRFFNTPKNPKRFDKKKK
jgi:hypothetical protein